MPVLYCSNWVFCLLFSGFRKNGFEHLQKGVYIVMELNLNGKVVVVTGSSSGIGEETAMEFAREGCEVTIASRSEKKLAEAAGRFEVLILMLCPY